jgi:hypothetical protein
MSKDEGGTDPRVHYGPPPEEWLWDLYPLAEKAWGNVLGFNDGLGDGNIIDMRLWLRPGQMSNFPPPAYRPAHAPLPPAGFVNGGVRRCYIPQAEDLGLVARLFPRIADPANPPWPRVEAELVAAGRNRGELATMNAPTLLLLLAKAKGFPGQEGEGDKASRQKPPHRPRQHDPVKDEKTARDWQASQAATDRPTQAEFEEAHGLPPGELQRVLDRCRKRQKRDGQSG